MVQSIISTFFGVCFPHRIVCDEDNDEVFLNLYGASSAVKVITTVTLLKDTVEDYLPESDLEAFLDLKEPFVLVVNGRMEQQAIGTSFLGTVFEEKFHLNCLSMFILPCKPLIPEHMRQMAHPDVSPNQFEEGTKSGYYTVNLSMNQTFGGAAEFHAQEEDDNMEEEEAEEEKFHANINHLHSDNDEIDSNFGEAQEDDEQAENEGNESPNDDIPVSPGEDNLAESSDSIEHSSEDDSDEDSYEDSDDDEGGSQMVFSDFSLESHDSEMFPGDNSSQAESVSSDPRPLDLNFGKRTSRISKKPNSNDTHSNSTPMPSSHSTPPTNTHESNGVPRRRVIKPDKEEIEEAEKEGIDWETFSGVQRHQPRTNHNKGINVDTSGSQVSASGMTYPIISSRQSTSGGSSSASITDAMNKATLHSRNGSAASLNSKDSTASNQSQQSAPKPFRFSRNNTAQQNLDAYIASSRREISSSSYFQNSLSNNDQSSVANMDTRTRVSDLGDDGSVNSSSSGQKRSLDMLCDFDADEDSSRKKHHLEYDTQVTPDESGTDQFSEHTSDIDYPGEPSSNPKSTGKHKDKDTSTDQTKKTAGKGGK
ncbi:hypothetical protein, partial, partial [Parasitella parasitica]